MSVYRIRLIVVLVVVLLVLMPEIAFAGSGEEYSGYAPWVLAVLGSMFLALVAGISLMLQGYSSVPKRYAVALVLIAASVPILVAVIVSLAGDTDAASSETSSGMPVSLTSEKPTFAVSVPVAANTDQSTSDEAAVWLFVLLGAVTLAFGAVCALVASRRK